MKRFSYLFSYKAADIGNVFKRILISVGYTGGKNYYLTNQFFS